VGKNVAVFVDVANIFYAAKAAGVDIDYVTLLKSATAGRDLVRAYAYTGSTRTTRTSATSIVPRRNSYKVVSKDIRKYGDGKVKANLDIELVVDMMKTARNLDIAIVVSVTATSPRPSGPSRRWASASRSSASAATLVRPDRRRRLFTDITQLARVEKGLPLGRRVADDDEDLSMTEVPDKQTEGTGVRPGRAADRAGVVPRGGPGRSRAAAQPDPVRCAQPVAARPVATAPGLSRSR
jgi:hypothetical protein